ncbi:MAG TPA: hypothetical protein VNB29_06315 [Chthoniobacterales bacterium]|nr:hypothetical protein [Chthoniobacterales bacterium]
MSVFLRILAVLFFCLAIFAVADAGFHVYDFRKVHATGQSFTEAQLSTISKGLFFTWVAAAVYGMIGMAFWRRRRLSLLTILLILVLIGQWMNVGYPTAFVLSLIALVTLAFSSVRASFRN